MVPRSTSSHYRAQATLTVAVLASVRRSWRRMGPDFDGSWRRIQPQVVTTMAAGQLAAVRSSSIYLDDVLDELNIDGTSLGSVNPRAFVGVASDGRALDSLLYGSVTRAKAAVAAGLSPGEALVAGGAFLDTVVRTQITDAERVATGTGIVARPFVGGYTRMLSPPSCSRCALLAGKPFRFNQGFLRHPRCDCRHIPRAEVVEGDPRVDPKAMSGISTAGTPAGRGRARVMPEAIYERAGSREEAVGLLRQHGFIV